MKNQFLIFCFPILVISQENYNLESFIGGSGIYINNFNYSQNSDSTETINSYKVSLNELKISLNNFHIIGQNNGKKRIYDFELNKPDFTLKGLKLSRKTFSNNWITTEKIKQLKKRESIAQEAILMIRDAASNYERDLNSVPKSLDKLAVENYLDLKNEIFLDKTWQYSMNFPESIDAIPGDIDFAQKYKIVSYNLKNEKFNENPTLDSLINNSMVNWKYQLDLNHVNILTKTKINIAIDSLKNDNIVKVKNGNFLIEKLTFQGIPDSKLDQLVKAELPEIVFNLSEVWLETNLSDYFIIHKGLVEINFKNTEIKFPSNIRQEPYFERILNKLGVWNNLILIKKINFNFDFINEKVAEIKIDIHTPFVRASLYGGILLDQDFNNFKIKLESVNAEINPISLGLKTLINNWESKKNIELIRRGGLITVQLTGDISQPMIKLPHKYIYLFEME